MTALEIFVATAPGLALSYLIFRLDRWEREPFAWLAGCFLAGAAATFPAVWVEKMGFEIFGQSSTLLDLLVLAFIVVALNEEALKWTILRLGPFPRAIFNEPFDGIVYAAMIGMGFATAENLIYAERFGVETALLRAFTAVPAHAAFAVFAGFFVGLAKFEPSKKRIHLAKGFALTVAAHGVYDFLVIQKFVDWLLLLATVLVYVCLWQGAKLIRIHQKSSPFRPQNGNLNDDDLFN